MFDKAQTIQDIADTLNSTDPSRFRKAEDMIKIIAYFEEIANSRTEQVPRDTPPPIVPPPACKICQVVPLIAYRVGADWFCEEHAPKGTSLVGHSHSQPSAFRIGRGTAYERMLAWWKGEGEKRSSSGEALVAHPPRD